MPLSNAQRDTLVKIIGRGILRRSVHSANKVVAAVFGLLIQQRSWVLRIEAEGSLESIPVVCEMILRLRDIGQKDLVSVFQRDMIILVTLHRLLSSINDFLRALPVSGSHRAHVSHR